MVNKISPSAYEFSKKNIVKAVATEVIQTTTPEIEKAIAEEIKIEDPRDGREIVELHKEDIDEPEQVV